MSDEIQQAINLNEKILPLEEKLDEWTGEGESAVNFGENSRAIGKYSVAEGYYTNAGMRGFKLDPALISDDGKTFTIVEGNLEGVTVEDYAYISLLDEPTGGWRPGIQAYDITNISDDLKSITLSSVVVDTAGNSLTRGQTTTASGKTIDTKSRLAWMLYFRGKPHLGTVVVSSQAHAEGRDTKATGDSSHSEGRRTFGMGDYTHTEGRDTVALAEASHAEGIGTYAWKDSAHAEGNKTHARGTASHAEGLGSEAYGDNSHAEGNKSTTTAPDSHAEGANTRANASAAHAEGRDTVVDGAASHGEGYATKVLSTASMAHAEGGSTIVSANYAHAEGNSTLASGAAAHAEGKSTKSHGVSSHAEGEGAVAGVEGQAGDTGKAAHAEGRNTVASGAISHAEGDATVASGIWSHSEGVGTVASGNAQHVQGKYNVEDTENKYAHIVGNGTGTSVNKRSNAHTIDWKGNVYFSGTLTLGNTTITEDQLKKILKFIETFNIEEI